MGNENNILWDKIFWGQLNEDGFREVKPNGFRIEELNSDSHLAISDSNCLIINEQVKEKEVEKKLATFLLKEARKKICSTKDIDSMKPLEKIRYGIPMRLKIWVKDMFLIYSDNNLYIVLNDSVFKSDCASMILSHSDNEWEEYDIPEDKNAIINQDDYVDFINNIYNKLTKAELTQNEQGILIAMKYLLEKFI